MEFPDYPMQIDVKRGNEILVETVGNMITEFDRCDTTVWGSFHHSSWSLCFKHFGTTIPLFASFGRVLLLLLSHHLGVLSYVTLHESALIIPNHSALMSQDWFRALNARGVSILLFGSNGAINSADAWHEARSSGANGICSDCPTALKGWLASHPLAPTDTHPR